MGAKIIIIFNEKANTVPEIFRLNQADSFICIWQLDEDLSFFENQIENSIVNSAKKLFDQTKRVKEKLAPHFILNCYDATISLNNNDRKPETSKGFVSVSHSQQLIAVYYSPNQSCGIDIEHFGPRILRIRHKFMNPAEMNFCGENVEKCLVVWAAKEALFKKFGGDTAFFAEKIHVNAFEPKKDEFRLEVDFTFNQLERSQVMNCVLFEEFVMVYTA